MIERQIDLNELIGFLNDGHDSFFYYFQNGKVVSCAYVNIKSVNRVTFQGGTLLASIPFGEKDLIMEYYFNETKTRFFL